MTRNPSRSARMRRKSLPAVTVCVEGWTCSSVCGRTNGVAVRSFFTWLEMQSVAELDPDAVIRPVLGEWQPHMPKRLDEEELADWRAGRNAIYQLAALTIGARLAVADG